MIRIAPRFAHFVFGVIQAGVTTSVATAIASLSFLETGSFLAHWMTSWAVAWITVLPIVVLAAPIIRKVTRYLTSADLGG